MQPNAHRGLTRRTFLRASLAVSAPLVVALSTGCALRRGPSPAAAQIDPTVPAQILPPTPECLDDDDDDLTQSQTEGPYFTPNSPERTSLLEPGLSGTRLILTGYVLGTSCQPAPGALIDFWQADDAGHYDNLGYRLRGHQFTDEAGRYTLETVVPGLYPGRTRHIHLNVQAPNRPVLTTQLYFSGEPSNRADRIFHPALALNLQDASDGSKLARFDFVLNLG